MNPSDYAEAKRRSEELKQQQQADMLAKMTPEQRLQHQIASGEVLVVKPTRRTWPR